jgi:hypothetical protein
MRTSHLLLLLLLLSPQLSLGQTPPKPPEQVVTDFLALETKGQRLTAAGRRSTDHFFLRPSPGLSDRGAFVIYPEYGVNRVVINGNTAEVQINGTSRGTITPKLVYRPAPQCEDRFGLIFRLTLSDKHWESDTLGGPLHEVSGPLEWRLEHSDGSLTLTRPAARRFLSQMLAKSKNPTLQKNATASLTQLNSQ